MQGNEFLADPADVGIDPARLEDLVARVRREVDEGLLPASQFAIARRGRLAAFETFGDAGNDSLFCIFSATKAITSAAAWLLIQEGKLDISKTVAEVIPEFAPNGKENITIEQVFLHTSGFPHAPFRVEDWPDKVRRYERFSSWRLNWEPGTRYEYHPTSSMWIIAELIERLSGQTYDSFVRERIAIPLHLPDLRVGTPTQYHDRIATICHVGETLTEQDYLDAGLPVPPITEVTPEIIENFNRPENRKIPVPGGGCITSAADLALFYQGLIGNTRSGEKIWSDAIIMMASAPRTGDLIDETRGVPVGRGLGVEVAGDEKRNLRGFGHTNSETAFGHRGAGGQIGWVDPVTGISFAYVTRAHDLNTIREARRGISISNKAAVCAD